LSSCGEKGILDIVYDYSEIKSVLSKESLKKDHDNSMWRYRALMPIKGEAFRTFYASVGRRCIAPCASADRSVWIRFILKMMD
jgi:hypothetical protein